MTVADLGGNFYSATCNWKKGKKCGGAAACRRPAGGAIYTTVGVVRQHVDGMKNAVVSGVGRSITFMVGEAHGSARLGPARSKCSAEPQCKCLAEGNVSFVMAAAARFAQTAVICM